MTEQERQQAEANCHDIFSEAKRLPGSSILITEAGHISSERRNSKQWEPPRAVVPGDPIDFSDLPF